MGIVESLSAGYRFLVRRLELLFLPLLLDAFLWMAPRLSVEPLLARLANFYADFGTSLDEVGGELGQMADQMTQVLTLAGQSSNLLDFLVSGTLYRMPSLLATMPGLKDGHNSVQIGSASIAGVLSLVLGLVGILIGICYMNLLARALPLGEGEKQVSGSQFVAQVFRQWLRTLGFVVGVILLLVIIYVPATIGTTLLMLISPALGSGAILLMSGLSVVVFFYLYFVTVGLVMDNLSVSQAVVRSFLLVRYNFWTTLGFIVVSGLIFRGIGMLLLQIAQSGPVGTLVAAPANAFIGTGLTLALLVFYRTRLLALATPPPKSAKQQV